MSKITNSLDYIIFIIIFSSYKYIVNSISLDYKTIKYYGETYNYNQILWLFSILSGLVILIISIVLMPLINKLVIINLNKNFPNEIIFSISKIKIATFFGLLGNFFVTGTIVGQYIIPFLLFSNNIQNSLINLILCIILSIFCFIAFINVQSYSYILTNKHVVALSIAEKIFYITLNNINNINPISFGININHTENIETKTHKILFAQTFINKFLGLYKGGN